jgi:hypothetical protein
LRRSRRKRRRRGEEEWRKRRRKKKKNTKMKTTMSCKDSMIYTVILYFVILNVMLAVLIHFCQLTVFYQ